MSNTDEKIPCPICGRLVKPSYLKRHQREAKACKEAQEKNEPYKPSNPDKLEKYRIDNAKKRQKKIEEIGLAEVQRIEREKQQAKRNKAKGIEAQPVTVETATPQPAPIIVESKELKPITMKKYNNDFKNFTLKYTGNEPDLSNIEWLKDTNAVIKYIKNDWKNPRKRPYSDATKKNVLTALGSVTKILKKEYGINGFEQASIIYKDASNDYSKGIKKENMDNLLSDNQRDKTPSLSDLVKLDKELTSTFPTTDFKDEALRALYLKIAPRRAQDYRLMIVLFGMTLAEAKKVKNFDTNYNYVLCGTDGVPKDFIFYNYKTAESHGRYTRSIPKDLGEILKIYIQKSRMKAGDFLFGIKPSFKEPYTQGAFSSLVKSAFHNKADINGIRHSFASHVLKQNLSQNQLEMVAKAMGTSRSELVETYNKLDIKDKVVSQINPDDLD